MPALMNWGAALLAMRSRLAATAIDQDFPETCGHMALGTILAESTAMHVVALVAAAALRANFGGVTGPVVAGGTNQPAMPSCQREIGRAVMIEIPRFPVVGIVTVLALRRCAQRPAMMIVLMA